MREVPDHVASTIVRAHPNKLYFADVDGQGSSEPGPDGRMVDSSEHNRMVDVGRQPSRTRRSRKRRTNTV